jgi:hypothetical protein
MIAPYANHPTMPKRPPNIEEFNIIAGMIFAQLYKAFPIRVESIQLDDNPACIILHPSSQFRAPVESIAPDER